MNEKHLFETDKYMLNSQVNLNEYSISSCKYLADRPWSNYLKLSG